MIGWSVGGLRSNSGRSREGKDREHGSARRFFVYPSVKPRGQGMPEGRTGPRAEMVDGLKSGWIHFGVPRTEHVTGTTSLT